MEKILFVFCFLLHLEFSLGATATTDSEIIGMMDTTVNIPCKITYSDTDPWYVVQWKKLINNKNRTLVTLSNTFTQELSPRWSVEQDLSEFKSRSRTNVFMDETSVTFNLTVYDFTCHDVGMYYCDVTSNTKSVGATNVSIKAKPLPPKIHTTYLILEINNTYTLECDAIVGIPPTDIHWYYRGPGELKFMRVQAEPEEEIQPGTIDCRPRAIQRLEVTGSEKSSGTTFRCVVNSASCGGLNDNCYADVIVEVPTPVKPPEPTYQVTCEGASCNKQAQDNGSSSFKGGQLMLISTGLLYLILLSGLS